MIKLIRLQTLTKMGRFAREGTLNQQMNFALKLLIAARIGKPRFQAEAAMQSQYSRLYIDALSNVNLNYGKRALRPHAYTRQRRERIRDWLNIFILIAWNWTDYRTWYLASDWSDTRVNQSFLTDHKDIDPLSVFLDDNFFCFLFFISTLIFICYSKSALQNYVEKDDRNITYAGATFPEGQIFPARLFLILSLVTHADVVDI